MTDKLHVKLPGKVEKVIKPGAGEPEKAQIAIEGADPLYREIRVGNELEDGTGQKLRLKLNDEVDVTVEAEKLSTQSEKQAESNENEPTEAKAS